MFSKSKLLLVTSFNISMFFLNLNTSYSKDFDYKFNNKDGKITFDLSTNVHPVKANVEKFKGFLNVKSSDEKNIDSVNGSLEIDTRSITTSISMCDARMKSETLSVSKYPKIIFKVSDVNVVSNKLSSDNTINLKLIGNLTIRNTSKKIEVPVKVTVANDKESAIVEGSYKVNFNDFNVPDPSVLIAKVDPVINLSFKLNVH